MTGTTTRASFSRAGFLRGGGALVVAFGLPASAWTRAGGPRRRPAIRKLSRQLIRRASTRGWRFIRMGR